MAKPGRPGNYSATTFNKGLEMNTLLMIKPDIVANGQYGEILAFVLKNRFEVTNREFKSFVDAGGYTNQDIWGHTFLEGGGAVSWTTCRIVFTPARILG